LESVHASRAAAQCEIEVCVSDNGSTDNTEAVVRDAQTRMPITYHKNERNLGIPRNFVTVVKMASGEFTWLLGDDDLLLPESLATMCARIGAHAKVDYFYVNSYHLTTEYVLSAAVSDEQSPGGDGAVLVVAGQRGAPVLGPRGPSALVRLPWGNVPRCVSSVALARGGREPESVCTRRRTDVLGVRQYLSARQDLRPGLRRLARVLSGAAT
jgi:glycosyltransferase involved in cell wall biosynthesis